MQTQKEENEVSRELLLQLRYEFNDHDWQEGFIAFKAREPFTMCKGQKWALGWLSHRLLGEKLGSTFIQ